jgi:hypothetical protein
MEERLGLSDSLFTVELSPGAALFSRSWHGDAPSQEIK